MPDGTVLVYGISGGNCFLQGCKGKPVHIEAAAEAERYPVNEIGADCFARQWAKENGHKAVACEKLEEMADQMGRHLGFVPWEKQ